MMDLETIARELHEDIYNRSDPDDVEPRIIAALRSVAAETDFEALTRALALAEDGR